MSDLQPRPEVECMKCGSEIQLTATEITDHRTTVDFYPACDCKMWDMGGNVPDSWVETDELGE